MSGASRRREMAHHKRAIRSAPNSGRNHCYGLAAAIRCHACIRRKHALDRIEVAALRRCYEPVQHADAGFLVDAEAAALGGDALACAMHELTARRRSLAECLRDVVVVAIEDVVQNERSALLLAEPLEQEHEREGQVAREFCVRLGRHDLDLGERLGQPRTEVRGPLRLRRAQPIDREPRNHGCQPRLGGTQLRGCPARASAATHPAEHPPHRRGCRASDRRCRTAGRDGRRRSRRLRSHPRSWLRS